jgi:murein DD-endopeptidase MepM/ murein hydrolase activator NlpD
VRPIGPASFAIEGRRAAVYSGASGLRALVPVPLTALPGPSILGLEIRGRRGRRRIPIEVTIGARPSLARTHLIPEAKRALLEAPERVRDSRLVLEALRTESKDARARGRLRPPVANEVDFGFGGREIYEGASFVPLLMDGLYGDFHRGLDYAVPIGTPVRAPAAAVVLLAQALTMTGQTVVLDHGRGLVSAFFHLSRIDVKPGDAIDVSHIVGGAGDSGLATTPHLHWGMYLHGVAIDPRALEALELD